MFNKKLKKRLEKFENEIILINGLLEKLNTENKEFSNILDRLIVFTNKQINTNEKLVKALTKILEDTKKKDDFDFLINREN